MFFSSYLEEMGAMGRAEDSAFAVIWLVAEKREALSLALLDRLAIFTKRRSFSGPVYF